MIIALTKFAPALPVTAVTVAQLPVTAFYDKKHFVELGWLNNLKS